MEDFVTFEIAKKLKEKGFNDDCHAYYEPLKHCLNLSRVFKTNSIAENYDCVTAPTISQVLKWLREECGIFILVEPDILFPEYKLTFTLRVKFYIKGEEDEGFSEKYLTYRRDSYELAALAGIEYCLDNLI